MPTCRFCGESMPATARTCTLCGSDLPSIPPVAAAAAAPRPAPVTAPAALPPGGRFCPGCGIIYDREYIDAFCICGTELLGAVPSAPVAPPEPVVIEAEVVYRP